MAEVTSFDDLLRIGQRHSADNHNPRHLSGQIPLERRNRRGIPVPPERRGDPAPAPSAPDSAPRPAEPVPAAADSRRPVVVVDDLHVKYKVYSSGKAAGSAANRKLFTKTRGLREVHAVKGVSFTAYENESIGIIGSNGSGKSTLMRTIVGLTPPASGAVYASSRPNLLGVGAALIPDLSGDKNITLGGLALGYTRKEVEALREEIVQFAELEDFIDLPMKTYSSGMSARLKFAIAASKQHEILIVDEALAVGDARFRQRSEAKIREIRENAGTVFLVSHSMKSILDTCSRVIWINKGVLEMDGDPDTVVSAYKESKK